MASTTTKNADIRSRLNDANPNDLMDQLHKIKVGNRLSTVKATVTQASAASNDITSTANTYSTLVGFALQTGEQLPAIGHVLSLRVTGGAAAAGARFVTDVGGTPSATVATISDDGKTLTFEAGVTSYVITYSPRADVSLDTLAPNGLGG